MQAIRKVAFRLRIGIGLADLSGSWTSLRYACPSSNRTMLPLSRSLRSPVPQFGMATAVDSSPRNRMG